MINEFAKQTEILFLWDGENWNPNGDMLNDNAPRYDEIAGKALVTDVRVKRTIRDDLFERKGKEIFVREVKANDGKGILDGKSRVKQFMENGKENVIEEIIKKCIDVRAFGGVFPVEKEQFNLTGAMQFKMSKTLHKVDAPVYIKGTGAFASEKGKENKTFREEYILPYGMFVTYGIVSGLSAKKSKFTNEDLDEILDSLWIGTKNLITRSKVGQMPRFLLKITYSEEGDFIGSLDTKLKVANLKVASETEIRSIQDFELDLTELISILEKEENKNKIEEIKYRIDEDLKVVGKFPEDWETF